MLLEWGVGFSIITALVLAFVPFVLATLVAVPASRGSLMLLSPLVLLGIFAAASIVWSPAAGFGAEKLTIWLVNGFLPAATIVVLYAAKRTISWRLILVAATIYGLALLLIGEPWSEGGQRLTVFDQNPIWAARAILVGALIAILGPFPPVVKIVTAPMLILAGVLTQSLGPTVGMAAGLLAGAITALVLHSRREGRLSPGWTILALADGFRPGHPAFRLAGPTPRPTGQRPQRDLSLGLHRRIHPAVPGHAAVRHGYRRVPVAPGSTAIRTTSCSRWAWSWASSAC